MLKAFGLGLSPEDVKREEYLAKRREQWRRRKYRKEQEALRDAD